MAGLSVQFEQHFALQTMRAEEVSTLYASSDAVEKHPSKNTLDEFDRRSVYFGIRHRESGLTAASVRMILADGAHMDEPFPIEAHPVLRRRARDHVWRVPRQQLGQISRFAVASEFRRRSDEALTMHGLTANLLAAPDVSGKRNFPLVVYGLFKAIVTMSTQHGIAYWYSMLDPTLVRLLARFGVRFQPIGPVVDYRNARQPCIAAADIVLSEIKFRRPELWTFVTDDGLTLPMNRH